MSVSRAFVPNLDANGWRLLAAKALRGFGFGLNAVVIGLYLREVGLQPHLVALVFSAALAGTLTMSLLVAVAGDRIGRRRLLVFGSALMATSLLVPFAGSNVTMLVFIGLSGSVAVTSGESTGLHGVDQAMLPQTAATAQRTAAFAAYNLVAAAAATLGALAVGPLVALGSELGLSGPAVYGPAFIAYAATGIGSMAFALGLDARVEVGRQPPSRPATWRPSRTVATLSVLMGIDALAGGFVIQSYLAYWLAVRFDANPAAIGFLFAVCNLLSAASFPVAAWIAGRVGLVRTMAFIHVPASGFLAAAAIVPDLAGAVALILARAACYSMDVPARQSYTMAIVHPLERMATAGITGLARGVGHTLGPGIAAVALVPLGAGAPLLAAGAVKLAYAAALYALFRNRPAPEELERPGPIDAVTTLE